MVGILEALGMVLDGVIEDAGRLFFDVEVVEVRVEPVFVELLKVEDEVMHEGHGVHERAMLLDVSLQEGLDLLLDLVPLVLRNVLR